MAANTDKNVIEIKGLDIAFPSENGQTQVLKNLNLNVRQGEFLAIVGASGVGKSTLLRILMDLAKPSAGTVHLNTDPAFDRAMALVFQDARLLPWRRILSNVAFGLEKLPLTRAERKERARAALAGVGLRDLGNRFPHQLSGGQRQRVALARALAVRPAILLMDEPFSALDIATRETLQDELARLHATTAQTIIFVTHDIGEALYLADRVIALGGRPGEVRSSDSIHIARPRERGDSRLADIGGRIKAAMAAEAAARDDWVI